MVNKQNTIPLKEVRKKKISIARILWYIVLSIAVIICAFPLYWVITSSVKPYSELFLVPSTLFPQSFSLKNYFATIQYTGFVKYLGNSLLISLSTTAITVVIGFLTAYGITRPKLRGNGLIGKAVLIAYMFPPVILIIPLFQIISGLSLANTHIGVIITYITFSFPFCTWMLVSYIKTIPVSLEESASIDGALNIQVMIRIILPLIIPAVATTAVYTFINAWNEFLYAFVIANSDAVRTLPAGLYAIMNSELMEWGMLLSWTTMMLIPSVIFFASISKYIIGGLTAGAVKG